MLGVGVKLLNRVLFYDVNAVICRRTPEAVECVANVVSEQCGGEIAGRISQLLTSVLEEGHCRNFACLCNKLTRTRDSSATYSWVYTH